MADNKDNKNSNDNKKVVLDYTIKELGRILESMRNGQMPELTKSLKKLTDIVNVAEKKVKENKVDDKELDAIFDKIAKDITDKK
jgi:hypothetical protein